MIWVVLTVSLLMLGWALHLFHRDRSGPPRKEEGTKKAILARAGQVILVRVMVLTAFLMLYAAAAMMAGPCTGTVADEGTSCGSTWGDFVNPFFYVSWSLAVFLIVLYALFVEEDK